MSRARAGSQIDTAHRSAPEDLQGQGRPWPSALAEFLNRPDLDRSDPRRGDLGRNLDGVVEVLRIDEVIAAKLLLRFGEGAVGARDLAIADPHGGGRLGRLERLAADVVPA